MPPSNDDSSSAASDSEFQTKDDVCAPTSENNKEGDQPPKSYEKLERLKREKRLAMNRECARARRRRKKLRLELLEGRVQEIASKNQKLQETNDAMRVRMAQLESELVAAKSTIAMMSGGAMGGDFLMSMNGMGGGMNMNGMNMNAMNGMQGMNMNGMGGGMNSNMQGMNDFLLQRRAALAGLGGANTGLGGMSGNNVDAFRMMQFNNNKGNNSNHNDNDGPKDPAQSRCPPGISNPDAEDHSNHKNSFNNNNGRNPFMNGGNNGGANNNEVF